MFYACFFREIPLPPIGDTGSCLYACPSTLQYSDWSRKGHAEDSWKICSHKNLGSTPDNNALNTLNFRSKKAQCQRWQLLEQIVFTSSINPEYTHHWVNGRTCPPHHCYLLQELALCNLKAEEKYLFFFFFPFSVWFHFKVSLHKVLSINVFHLVWILFFFPHHNFLGCKDATKLGHKSGHLHPAFVFFWYENYNKETLNVFVMPVLQNYLELKQWRAEIN